MNKKHKRLINIGVVFVVILTIAFSIPFIKYIENPEKLRHLIDSFGVFSSLAYIVLVSIQILIPFIPGEPFELFAGYAFGGIEGFIMCFIAEALGSFFVILIVRKLEHKIINYYFKDKDLTRLDKFKTKKAFVLYSILFIIPGTPKDILCYIGALNYDFVPVVVITTLGRIPAIVTSTIASDAIGDKNYLFGFVIYGITILLSLVGLLIYNKTTNQKNNGSSK